MGNDTGKNILDFIKANPSLSSKEIHDGLKSEVGYATVKRILAKLISENLILPIGKGRGTKYIIDPAFELRYPIDVEVYFGKEIDEREIKDSFNLLLIKEVLSKIELFTAEEHLQLANLQKKYK